MLTIISSPQPYSLSRHPVIYKMTSNKLITTAGVKAVVELQFSDVAEENEYFTLTWNNLSVTFTCKQTPDDSGKQFADNSGGATLNNWVDLASSYLRKNYLLSTDFTIEWNASNKIIITARKTGVEYSLTVDNNIADMTMPTNTAGITEVRPPNFKAITEIFIPNTNADDITTATKRITLEADPDEKNPAQFKFDLSAALHAHLSPDIPAYNQTAFSLANKIINKYYIRYGEQYGDESEVKIMTVAASKTFLLAGASYQEFPTHNNLITGYLATNKKFLSWQPIEKTIAKEQQEYLYFLNQGSPTQIGMKVVMTKKDGSTTTYVPIPTLINSPVTNAVYIFPATYRNSWGYNINDLKSYEITLINQALTPISETIKYTIETRAFENQRYFLFQNSLGGMDTLRATGIAELGWDLQIQNAEQTLADDYAVTDGQIIQVNSSVQDTMKLSTGFYSKDYILYLKDFLLSKTRYEILNDKFLPITIDSKKIKILEDKQNLFALNFEYDYANKDESFTPKL